ncbi:MAG: hypothetical protein ACJ72P_01670 [Nocardioides sp.]
MTPGQETARSSGAPARYELMVAGRIGPVLRSALRPPGGDAAQVCVVVRAAGPDGLVGLMEVFAAHGLRVRHVACVPDQG